MVLCKPDPTEWRVVMLKLSLEWGQLSNWDDHLSRTSVAQAMHFWWKETCSTGRVSQTFQDKHFIDRRNWQEAGPTYYFTVVSFCAPVLSPQRLINKLPASTLTTEWQSIRLEIPAISRSVTLISVPPVAAFWLPCTPPPSCFRYFYFRWPVVPVISRAPQRDTREF